MFFRQISCQSETNIVLFLTNQIADILYVSDKKGYQSDLFK